MIPQDRRNGVNENKDEKKNTHIPIRNEEDANFLV